MKPIYCFIALLIWAPSLFAEPPQRILLIETMPVEAVIEPSRHFVEELRARGWTPERLSIQKFQAQGSRERAKDMVLQEIRKQKPDLVVTVATFAAQGAFEALKKRNIPQLFFTVADPVGAGLVEQVGVPSGTNITGLVYTVPRSTKLKVMLPLLKQAYKSSPIRIGFIHTDYPSELDDMRRLKALEKEIPELEFVFKEIKYHKVPEQVDQMQAELRTALKSFKGTVDGFWAPQGGLGQTRMYNQTVVEEGYVVIYAVNPQSVQDGALLYLDPDYKATGHDAAFYAEQILKGKPAGELPVSYPTKFKLAVNLTTALKMGIVLPRNLLEMAGDNLYR
ncbi:MAG: ABC transporter substrate-binding protein [bacterium]|nr:ABC transporter substrate-binding protein [bacterium]